MATTTPPPQQAGFATPKDVQSAAKYTNNQFKSIYKNMVTTTNGLAGAATAGQQRTLAGMAKLSATSEAQSSRQIARSTAQQRDLFGAAAGGVVSQKMSAAKVQARANQIQNQGNQRAASDLAAGNTQAFQAYMASGQKSMVAAQTGLAEQMKLYNNAVEGAQGGAKTVLANATSDGAYVNKVYNQVGKTLDRAEFFSNLISAGYYNPNDPAGSAEANFMWTVYNNMSKTNGDAGTATHMAASTLYGDVLKPHELNTIIGGTQSSISSYATNRAEQMAKDGSTPKDANTIGAEIARETGMDLAQAVAMAQNAIDQNPPAPAEQQYLGASPVGVNAADVISSRGRYPGP